LAPDHLDRYPTVEAYYADKRLLFRNASDASVWVVNGDDAAACELARGARGRHLHFSVQGRADAWFDRSSGELMLGATALVPRTLLGLLGDHNVENVLAAALAVGAAGVAPTALARGIESFRPPAHRLEVVRTMESVTWINDSKATNVAAAAVALRAMDRPYLLIAGGHPKGESFAPLAPLLGPWCRGVIAYGEAGPQLTSQLGATGLVAFVERFDDAVAQAALSAPAGGAVLLSPACASFDQFANFEERGDRFRALVEAL
jgi:UDP-N-acetylmuramoylalanine--D-glutamate ligase